MKSITIARWGAFIIVSGGLILLVKGCWNQPYTPPLAPQAVDDSAQIKHEAAAVKLRTIVAISDSLNKNIARGYHAMAIGNRDSAYWYGGKAGAYNEMMHAQYDTLQQKAGEIPDTGRGRGGR